jgi:hypothetical protein
MTTVALAPMTSGHEIRRRKAPSIALVATTAACIFLVVLLLMAAQLRTVRDAGLGTSALPAAVKHAPASNGHAAAPLVTKSSGGG